MNSYFPTVSTRQNESFEYLRAMRRKYAAFVLYKNFRGESFNDFLNENYFLSLLKRYLCYFERYRYRKYIESIFKISWNLINVSHLLKKSLRFFQSNPMPAGNACAPANNTTRNIAKTVEILAILHQARTCSLYVVRN